MIVVIPTAALAAGAFLVGRLLSDAGHTNEGLAVATVGGFLLGLVVMANAWIEKERAEKAASK